jgi:hypothetical protein
MQQPILEGNDNEQPIIDIYVAGQDCATSSIKEIGVTLMKRNYPKVATLLVETLMMLRGWIVGLAPSTIRQIMKNKKCFMAAQVDY